MKSPLSLDAKKAVLQTRYYDRRALSAISDSPTFKFTSVAWGKGYIELDESGRPYVGDIPVNVDSLEGEFFRNEPVLNYANGITSIRATLPAGTVAEGDAKEFTTLLLLDDESDDETGGDMGVVAVMVCLPVWVDENRSLVVEASLETNIA
ncbi:hypothetical protein [Thaumasiovibrio sp. DFM-14]|uniref:hypothetical protein n=1 Tax=Thaumasiovibrio sp. DFM-14 TaxID=3384792 RepID=UPI0039A39A5B